MAYPLNLAKIVLNWTLPNSLQAQNVLHAIRDDIANLSVGDCTTIGAEISDWYRNDNYNGETNEGWKGWLIENCQLTTVVVSDSGPGPTVQATTAVNVAGENTGIPLPNESALVSTWYTDTPGRRGRGRTFWPGMTASSMSSTDGTLDNTVLAGMQDSLDALHVGFHATAYRLAVHSVANLDWARITSVVARDTIHHQRRRNT